MANYNDRGGRRSDDYKRPNRKNSDGFRYSDDRKPRFNDDRKVLSVEQSLIRQTE